LYANIIVDITHEKLDKHFQYKVPEKMLGILQIGMLVTAPFGRGNRMIQGYVVEMSEQAEFAIERIKSLDAIVQEHIPAEANLIALAGWIRKNYGGTMIQSLKTVLPVKEKIKNKEKKMLRLLLLADEAYDLLDTYQRKKYTAKARLLEALINEQELSYEVVTKKLNVSATVIKSFELEGILTIETEQIYRNPLSIEQTMTQGRGHTLSGEQQYAVDKVLDDRQKGCFATYLLHGITGSGKTEVYIELISNIIEEGKQAIVLIPEIALTYQTVMRFYSRFGDKISIINSRLSKGEKFDQFERAKNGQISVMIGPRSALFTPFANLGIIIIDEEHESSYKSESIPRYHAREVAIQRANTAEASVVLGSATPSIEAYYRALDKKYTLLELKQRAKESQLPQVYTIDLREELRAGNRSIISERLHHLIQDRLQKKQQIILFLNRRGYAGFISCRACGYVKKCPHCDVSLTIHNNGKLSCHYCGHEEITCIHVLNVNLILLVALKPVRSKSKKW